MKDLLYQIGLQLLQNMLDAVKKYEVFGSGVLLFAVIATMPKLIPKTLQDWWTWIEESLKFAIPVRQNPQLPQIQPSTPPKIDETKKVVDVPKID